MKIIKLLITLALIFIISAKRHTGDLKVLNKKFEEGLKDINTTQELKNFVDPLINADQLEFLKANDYKSFIKKLPKFKNYINRAYWENPLIRQTIQKINENNRSKLQNKQEKQEKAIKLRKHHK